MPETAAFDAVLGRSLTVVGLGVTCSKNPWLTLFTATPRFATPIDRPMFISAVAAIGPYPR